MAKITEVKIGATQVGKIYCGTDLVFQKTWLDNERTPPTTTPRPSAGTFAEPQTIWLDVSEPSDTYYTLDGTTPTIDSPKYLDGIYIDKTTTLKYFSIDKFGIAEDVKTSEYTIQVVAGYRYVRFIGHGDQTSVATTRLVEFQALEGVTNRLLNKVPISGEPVNAGATIDKATDGSVVMTSGTYPIWWSGAGIPTLTYDLGATFPIDTLKVWTFSTVNDPRQSRFILLVSKDNTTWNTVVDYSANTVVQPTDGWVFAL